MFVFFECLIQNARRLDDIAGAHPNELRQTVVRLCEARLQSDAFAQGQLGLVESLQGDEAASMRVVQRGRRSGAAQRLTHDALAFLRLVGRIQRDSQGMGCNVVVRSECHETTIVRHRFALRDPERRMPPRAAPTNRHRPCRYCTMASQCRVPMPAGPRPGSGESTEVRPEGSEGSRGLPAATRARLRRRDPRSAITPQGWSAWEPTWDRFRSARRSSDSACAISPNTCLVPANSRRPST